MSKTNTNENKKFITKETFLEFEKKEIEPGLSSVYAPFPPEKFLKLTLASLAEYHNVPLQ